MNHTVIAQKRPADGNAVGPLLTRAHVLRLVAAIVFVFLLPLLARHGSPTDYYIQVAVSTAIFAVLFALAARQGRVGAAVLTGIDRFPVSGFALVVLLVSVAACLLVFDNVPHVSDEVAYQFQARALALGRLWVPSPANYEFFDFLHTINDGTKWYGIMNPGWPVLLAIGYAVGIPWIINPILAAATLLLLFSFFRKAGYQEREARIAIVLIGISPFFVFMAGTYMAHTANLFLFAVFLWAWLGVINSGRIGYAAVAGVAIAANLLVRPLDTAAATAPFLLFLFFRALRDKKLWPHLVVLGALASSGVAMTWLYNLQLTGDWRMMPMEKYFTDLNPNEKFGLGFGADMGTKVHGPEWPGYYPLDAIRVTSQRVLELLNNLHGLPLVLVAALFSAVRIRKSRSTRSTVHALLIASALSLVGLYIFHFYHGIAYGARHYFLAMPAVAVVLAALLTGWIEHGAARTASLARAGLVAALVFTVSVPYLTLIREYGRNYRGSSAALRDVIEDRSITNAVVFVAQDTRTWAWKSAFPLNEYPLEHSPVIFAKDHGPRNEVLRQRFPTRDFYLARVRGTRVELQQVGRAQP